MRTVFPGIDIACAIAADGKRYCHVSGVWTLANIAPVFAELKSHLNALAQSTDLAGWDGQAIEALDSAGAMLLWQVWGRQLPAGLQIQPQHLKVFARLQALDRLPREESVPVPPFTNLRLVGAWGLRMLEHCTSFLVMLGQLLLDCWHVLRFPADFPRREMTATIYKAGVKAMPVTALVGGLIGIVLSYLSSLQLRQFGADVFIIKILGLGCVRELGPVLVAVLVAGRSGSAMTAQLGVMRVTDEIDALATMGVSRSLRLVFPKVLALSTIMPFLVLWTSAAALLGGMVSAELQLDISYGFFIETLPKAVPVANVWIALAKGWFFGLAIGLVACHFGLRVQPNTESLSLNTTAAVVVSIAAVILINAVFAIVMRGVGTA